MEGYTNVRIPLETHDSNELKVLARLQKRKVTISFDAIFPSKRSEGGAFLVCSKLASMFVLRLVSLLKEYIMEVRRRRKNFGGVSRWL